LAQLNVTMAIDWVIVGSASGGASLIVWLIRGVIKLLSRPKLKIDFDKSRDLVVWGTYHNGMSKKWTRKFVNLQIEKAGKDTAMRCEAVVAVVDCPSNVTHLTGKYPVHWADTPYSGRTTGGHPVDIGSSPQRLDVVFSDKDNPYGTWLAVPFALLSPDKANQFFLPPGDYTINVEVSCSNGGNDSKRFRLISPRNWTDLDVAAS